MFPSHEIRCLGGFTGKPDGQVFLVPVTATIPVLPLKPGEKPIQIKVDLDKQKYHLAPTNLTYLGQEGMVVMEIREFSTNGVGALSTDESSGYTEPPPSCCFEYPTPFGCCCALGIEAVSDFSGLFTSSSGPGGSTDCSIVGMTVTVTFPLCPGSPQETSWVQETTGDCPEDMICRIEVNPSVTNLFVCKEQKLTASVNCEDEDGKSVQFTNSKFEPFWGIDNPYAGTIDPRTGTVRGLKEGLAQVEATWAIPDEHFIPGQSVVNVRSNIRSFSVSPSQATIKVGNGRILQVEIVGAEGNLLDPSNISWSSSDPSKAYVAFGTGGWTSVEGVDCGTVIITARYQYDCETVETTATIKVVKPNVSVMPASACIVIGDTILLTANVTDDCYGNPITDCTVVWPPNSSGVVVVNPSGLVTGIAEGQADVSAVCDDRIGFATIKVVKPSVTVTPGQPTIRVCDTIQLTATVTACPGTPYTGCTLTWYSSNTDVAVVDASGLVTAKHGGQANISAVCGDWIGVATVTVKGFTGVWDDSFGATLRITVDRTTGVAQGTYSGYWDFCGGTYHGAIEGQTSGHGCVLTGTWHDNFSAVQYGNDPWICFTGENGTFEFHLSPGGDSFTGSFIWLCVEGMGCRDDFGGGSWNGVRRVNP
ncbi:MAG: Ig-like domain-containing protein [Syntrophaceae bacterium]|nr:Ig-like domain-containing protein [Syntrophaceae bacterium]